MSSTGVHKALQIAKGDLPFPQPLLHPLIQIENRWDGRWLRTRREWVEDYVNKKLVRSQPATPDIPTVRIRNPRKGQAVFRKGGMGYQFLKERQQNQE
jgi:hypothetical protein